MTSSKDHEQWGVTFIGDGAIGKTSLCIQFALGTFPDIYIPVVAENYVVEVELAEDDQRLLLCLWDTPGQEDYPRLRPLAYANAHVILIGFAVDDRTSFNNVEEKWIGEARFERPGLPIILVGCKRDLRDGSDPTDTAIVAANEGSETAKKIGAADYLESSAKTGQGVAQVFQVAAKQILLHQEKLGGRKGLKRCCIIF